MSRPAYMSGHHMHAVSEKTRKGYRSPGTGVMVVSCHVDAREESNLGPLEEQAVILPSEPSLQPPP